MHDEGQNSQNWGFEIPNEQREFHFHDTDSVPNSFCILYHILLPHGVPSNVDDMMMSESCKPP